MGKIVHVVSDPQKWRIVNSGAFLKSNPNVELIKVVYGTFDDDPGGIFEIETWIRKDIYDRLMAGEYSLRINREHSQYAFDFLVYNCHGDLIPPILDDAIY